jgi:hypothetical protein
MALGFTLSSDQAQANIKQSKMYKEAFDGSKPKCIDCHVSDKPKKEDGQHELNDYGLAVKAAAAAEAEITADTYKQVGASEDFKKKEQE